MILAFLLAILVHSSYAYSQYACDTSLHNFEQYYKASTHLPRPTVTSIYPHEGTRMGKTPLTIWGSNFVYSPQLQCGFVEWASDFSWRGRLITTDATFVHSSMITCLTPESSGADGFDGSGTTTTTNPCKNANICDVKVMVSNGGEWSSYPFDFNAGTALDFKWHERAPAGTFTITNAQNQTGPVTGGTEVTIQVDSTSGYNFYASDMLTCKFGSTDVVATFLGYNNGDKTKSMIHCISPAGSAGAGTISISNWNGDDSTYEVDSGIAFTYIADNAGSTTPAHYSIKSNIPTTTIKNALIPARGPLFGHTDITITNTNGDFHPSNNAYCLWIDPNYVCTSDSNCEQTYGWSCCTEEAGTKKCCANTKAFFVDNQNYRCVSPSHPGIGAASGSDWPDNVYTEKPGFIADVRLSINNVDGATPVDLSASAVPYYFPNAANTLANTKFWFTDIYVSADGNDVTGFGTGTSPYRTIQRAMNQALFNQENGEQLAYNGLQNGWGIQNAIGSDRHFNRDKIILRDGLYRGSGNKNLRPGGKLIDVEADSWDTCDPFSIVVDCENSGETFIVENAQRYWDNDDSTAKESITVKGINIVRCETYKVYSAWNPFTKSNVPYHNPIKVLRDEVAIEPRYRATRSAYYTPGVITCGTAGQTPPLCT